MIVSSRSVNLSRASHAVGRVPFASSKSAYGQTAAYRRISTQLRRTTAHEPWSSVTESFLVLSSQLLRSRSLSDAFRREWARVSRTDLHTSTVRLQEQRRGEDVKDPPRQEGTAGSKAEEDSAKASSEQQTSEESSEQGKDEQRAEGEKEQQKKENPPPPPPHGDKTPWQVFTETLQSEFKASKEWNESTKALASSAHQFTENESVKRARAAYTAASGAATSKTSSALRGTGKALGQGAAWTWDTPVVKGVRSGVTATGRGIEKATRPVRETEVYKTAVGGVRDVIDDGSSSRYGGWVEKEERRKKRELRELNEARAAGRFGKRMEKVEEDPKYVLLWRLINHRVNGFAALALMSRSTKTQHGKSRGESSKTRTG